MRSYRYLTTIMLGLAIVLPACLPRPPQPMGSLEGTVLAEDGSPVAGAELVLMREDALPTGSAREATTDEAGAFRLDEVRVGVYNLTVRASPTTGAFEPGIVIEEDEVTSVALVTSPLGSIAGTLLLNDDPSSEGAEVQLPGTPFTQEVEANGDFLLEGVPSGSYRVRLVATGYGTVELTEVEVVSGETFTLPDTTLERVAPFAAFTATVVGSTVEVDASASRDPNGSPLTYRWEFGDGTSIGPGARAVRAAHSYRSSGVFTITLTVTNPAGHSDSTALQVEVFLPRLTAGQDHAESVPPSSERSWEVRVPASLSGEVLYFEVASASAIEVEYAGATFVSTTSASFRRLAPGGASSMVAGSAAELAPQAIAVGRTCAGPCVIVPNRGGEAVLRVHNATNATLPVTIRLPAEQLDDRNEPNDSRAAATPITGTDTGAIEVVGDVDWYVTERGGLLHFEGQPAIELEARIYDAEGSRLATLQLGQSANVVAGDYVEVRARGAEAGPSGSSLYSLSFD